jgi:hypothetical protein
MSLGRSTGRRLGWGLGIACAVGFVLRITALDYGLPGVYHPDEIPILSRALALAKGDPNPHNFLYPSLHFYLLFAWEALFFVVGWIAGWYRSAADFQAAYFRDPSSLVLAGRALTAVFGTLTLLAVFDLGRRLFDPAVGVAAAVFLAVSSYAVRDAHYVKLDVPVTFFATIALAAVARLVTTSSAAESPRSWLAAGLLAGLAMSTQYYVIFLALTIAVVAVGDIRRSGGWRPSARLLAWAALGSTVGFLAGTPFIVVELETAMRDIAGVREVDIDRALAAGGGAFTSLPAYLRMLAVEAMGWPVSAAAVLGAALVLRRDWRRAAVLLVFPLAYLVFIAHTVPMSRYVNCMLPSMAVLAAFGIVTVMRRIRPRQPAWTAVVVVLAAVPGLAASIRAVEFYGQTDTRTLARDFIEAQVPAGSSILVQPYSAPIHRSRESLVEALRSHLGSEDAASVKYQMELAIAPPLEPAYRTIYYGDGGADPDKIYVLPGEFDAEPTLAPLRRRGIGYVVLKAANVPNPETARLEAALAREGRLLATFSPYRDGLSPEQRARVAPFIHNVSTHVAPELERPGPVMSVWQIP